MHFIRREVTEPSCRQFRANPECYYVPPPPPPPPSTAPPPSDDPCPDTCRRNPDQSLCAEYSVRFTSVDNIL